jgi:GNAT superfamily N-acetyltransferase
MVERVRALDGYPVYLPDGDFHRFLTRPAPLASWVVEVDGSVVGHVALNSKSHPGAMEVIRTHGITGEVGVMARLLVDPLARNRGFGALLLDQARAEAFAMGRTPVLDVMSTARNAVSLYQATGWLEIGRCRFTPSDLSPVEEIVFASFP